MFAFDGYQAIYDGCQAGSCPSSGSSGGAGNNSAASDYPAWDALATELGFEWESYVVTTSDGWELTLFRIVGEEVDSGKNPILFMHGGGMDAEYWVRAQRDFDDSRDPIMVQLAKKGYDVWLGSNRGTKYSNVNTNYPDWKTDEY